MPSAVLHTSVCLTVAHGNLVLLAGVLQGHTCACRILVLLGQIAHLLHNRPGSQIKTNICDEGWSAECSKVAFTYVSCASKAHLNGTLRLKTVNSRAPDGYSAVMEQH